MATVNRQPSASVHGGQVLRDAWHVIARNASRAFWAIAAFFIAFPPLAQGLYYLLTGLWPLLHMRSFEAVTGPKTDTWLVQTVGVLVVVIGGAMCLAAYRRQGSPEILFIAFGSALGLAAIDVIFVYQGRIRPVYLLDAGIQVGLVALWVYGW